MFKFSPKSRLTARTRSGVLLGTVVAVEIDETTGRIVQFLVSANRVISAITDNVLVIAWSQVIDWKEDEIIVSDGAVARETAKVALSQAAGTPAHFSEEHP
ncbi:MAG: PRC-barrel domain-containing protein [Patescibacteria group bacterium]|nr:PRC-barrel domain-containing protein [Patescibacteria group bacterium]